jgi:hypothetical protein
MTRALPGEPEDDAEPSDVCSASEPYVHPLIWDAGAADYELIPPRPWLLGSIVCRRFLTLLYGSGGVGKSSIALAMAMSMASGPKPDRGEPVRVQSRGLHLV